MIYDYLITIKKSDNRLTDQVSQLLYIFAIAAFGFFIYQSPKTSLPYALVIASILVKWIFAILAKRKTGHAYFRLGLLFAAIGWLIGFQRNIYMAVLYALAGILEKQVKFPQEIGFSDDGIFFNTLPRKTLLWNDVANVIIKDGLITVDQKNNKLFQKEIEGYVTEETETEFNTFCRQKLGSASSNQ